MYTKSIRQTEAAECGLACLAIASGILGADVDLGEVRRKHQISSRGLTVQDLVGIASAMQLTARPVRCEIEEVSELVLPSILHWGLNHFVVLRKVSRKSWTIDDPARGLVKIDLQQARKKFTGVAVEIGRAGNFQRKRIPSPLKLMSLVGWNPDIVGGLAQTFLLSVLLQAYIVASPFYIQLAIDEGAMKGDQGILVVLAVGFGLFGLFNVVATALRAVALQKMSALLGWSMTGRLFRHMVRLPLPWFQRRRLADAFSRFESIEPVRGLFANGLVSSIIDGMLAIVTLIMMVVFAWKLALIAVAGVAVYIAIRMTAIPLTIRLSGDLLLANVAEQGRRIETIRAMQTIKVMGAEARREGDWSNKYADTVREGQKSAFANIGFSSLQSLSDTIGTVAIIYLGAKGIIENTITVGALYAFMSYKTQFTARAQGLFETFVNWRLLDVHSDRLADIALTPIEEGIDSAPYGLPDFVGNVEIRNLGFKYSPQEPMVFQGVNANIGQGEFIAIAGPSGAGKSTLVKVLCGLYPSSAGEIVIDGLSINGWGPTAIRKHLGVVLQDDELLSGSIAENVAFFADVIDFDWVWECLRLASIDEEVRSMPMRADSLIGDMGSSLSGGQKQRILLARALYRRPKILVLDEATSHLDVSREQAINKAVKSLTVTRIVVAHRPETIASADRIFLLQNGRLTEVVKSSPQAKNNVAG